MFPVPRYSEEPTTLFLERLQVAGFFGWFTFDLSHDRSALWKAMALGLLQHTQMKYPVVQRFLESKWKPKIEELCRIDRPGDAKYEDGRYWHSLGKKCEDLALDFFRTSGKAAHIEEIQRNGYLSPSNKVAYDLLTCHFNICLCWYESLAANQVVTHVFHSQAKGDVSLFICIAQEGDRLYFLYHQSGRGDVKLDFPFAMKVKDSGKPLIIDSNDVPPVVEDVHSVITRKLAEAVDAEAEFLLSICSSVPAEAKDKYLRMVGKVQAAKAYVSLRHLEVDLSTPSLQKVLNLPDFQPISPKKPHTVLTCEQYPEDQDWLSYHGHYFHRTCLSNHLLEISLEYPNMPKCPLADCPHQLPDTVLDLNQGIREAYERSRLRAQAELQAIQQLQLQGSASVPASSYNLTCAACQRTIRRYYFLQHGCEICVFCAYQAGGEVCPACCVRLTLEEMTLIYREGQRSWR